MQAYAHNQDLKPPDAGDAGEHAPPQERKNSTCIPLYVVCHGKHPTDSRSCKHCFFEPKHTDKSIVNNAKCQIQTPTTKVTRESLSRQRTPGTVLDRSESFPQLRGRSRSQGRSLSRSDLPPYDDTNKRVAWEGGKLGHQIKAHKQTHTLRLPQNPDLGRTRQRRNRERAGKTPEPDKEPEEETSPQLNPPPRRSKSSR